MLELFRAMMKEEYRLHSTLFGSLSFTLFPVMICAIAFMGTFLIPLLRIAAPSQDIGLSVHAMFLLMGIMVGAFGLLGKEVMNRRFGQASLLSYSARTLPLGDRFIFLNFVCKDTLYYFLLWVFPFCLGFAIASPFVGIPVATPFLLLLTTTLAFLTGLAWVFFLSSAYSRSKKILIGTFLALIAIWALVFFGIGVNLGLYFPPLMLFHAFSLPLLAACLILIAVPFTIAIFLFTNEFGESEKHYVSRISPLTKRLSMFPYPPLAAKDLLDIFRSGAAIGQTIFSFLLPLGIIWFFLSVLGTTVPQGDNLLFFAMTTGIISSTMYTWLTEFDTYGAYACLPLGVPDVISSKVTSFSVMQVIPAVFLACVGVLSGSAGTLIPALAVWCGIAFYTLAVTVYLTGLSPSVLVYSAKTLISYGLLVGPVLLIVTALAMANPWYAAAALLLLAPAWWILRAGKQRWATRDQPVF